jgi:hypothetical protein
MLPNCHICDFIGSSLIPVLFYLLACASCGLPFLCLWCAFRCRSPWEVQNRGSFRSEEATRQDSTTNISEQLDDIRRAHIVSRTAQFDDVRRAHIVSSSLVTARATAMAIRPITNPIDSPGDDDHLRISVRTIDSTINSSGSSSPRLASLIIADDERGLDSEGKIDESDASRLVLDSTGWEVDVCAICTEPYDANDLVSYSKGLRCRHNFHPECIRRWLVLRNDCPCCRSRYVQ